MNHLVKIGVYVCTMFAQTKKNHDYVWFFSKNIWRCQLKTIPLRMLSWIQSFTLKRLIPIGEVPLAVKWGAFVFYIGFILYSSILHSALSMIKWQNSSKFNNAVMKRNYFFESSDKIKWKSHNSKLYAIMAFLFLSLLVSNPQNSY